MPRFHPDRFEQLVIGWLRLSLEIGICFGLFIAFTYVVIQHQYEAFGKTIVPILATYIATAALLYNRARGLPKNKSKTRSLYAAERAIQATLFTLTGTVIGAVIYGWLYWFKLSVPKQGDLSDPGMFIYAVPFGFLETGCVVYLLGMRAISKEFLRSVTAREISRRIKNAP